MNLYTRTEMRFSSSISGLIVSLAIFFFILHGGILLTGCGSTAGALQGSDATKAHATTATGSILEQLSSDEMMGRKPGTDGMERAAGFLEAEMQKKGVRPFFPNGYRDTVDVLGRESYNLVGMIPGENENEYVILSAHYDHVGVKSGLADSIFNGANDNASGVTAVLQIAEMLSGEDLSKSVLIIFFTGEESGLIGSKHLAGKFRKSELEIKYMINFEMVGSRLDSVPGTVYMTGFNGSNLAELMNSAGRDFIRYWEGEDQFQLFRRSDNYPFFQELNIPAQTISSFNFTNYPYYHHFDDESQELDLENMQEIIDNMGNAILYLLRENKEIRLKN